MVQGLFIWGTISGVAIFGWQLSGGELSWGAIVREAIIWGAIIRRQLSKGAIVRGAIIQGTIVLFPKLGQSKEYHLRNIFL